jgi:hypothetical protein
MNDKYYILAFLSFFVFFSCNEKTATNLQPNTWVKISTDPVGARRSSAIRFAENEDIMLLWGFHGYDSSDYGNPEKPWDGNKEYDIVAFDLACGTWKSHLPHEKQDAWADNPPPMHMCSYYQGITIGSHRPQLKMREGVLRPDLNVVFDQVTWDSKRERMVYFTGGRTFAYDPKLREWSDICQGQSAPPVLGGSLCYDPIGDQVILAGGGHVAELDSDGNRRGDAGTWVFDCQQGTWAPLKGKTELPPRIASRMVYDSKRKVMVIFGGDNHTHYLADTWIFNPQTREWKQSKATQVPAARAGHFTVYDPKTGLVIAGGGYNHENLSDMWGYDVASDRWQKLQGTVPTGWYTTADIIPDKSTIVLMTATKRPGDTKGCNEIYPVRTTYAFRIKKQNLNDDNPQPIEQGNLLKRPVEEVLAGTRPDLARHEAQMQRINNMPVNQWVLFDDPGRKAPSRTWGSCSFDVNRSRIVYWGGGHCGYGGNDYDFYDVEQNTWISSPQITPYPERNWDKSGGVYPAGLMFDGSPFMRHGRKAYAWDPVNDLAINMKYIYLTAGYEPEWLREFDPVDPDFGSGENYNFSGYTKWVTWTYDDKTEKWEILCTTLPGLDLLVSTPHGVMGVDYFWRMSNSEERPDMTLWKGKPAVDNSVYLLDVPGKTWKKLTKSGPWPQNLYEMSALVYDSRRDQLILHGGGENRDELWKFPLKTGLWEKLAPTYDSGTGGQPPVCRREAVYLPDDDVFFTLGRPAGENTEAGFWAYHVGENRWARVDINPPEGLNMENILGQNRAWAYDPKHDIILMVLGERNTSKANVYALKFDFRQ